jgi:hypothetical protein
MCTCFVRLSILSVCILWFIDPSVCLCGSHSVVESLQSHHLFLVQWTNPLLPITRDLGSNPLGGYLCETGSLLLALTRYIGDPDVIDHCGLVWGRPRPETSLGPRADNVIIPLDLTQLSCPGFTLAAGLPSGFTTDGVGCWGGALWTACNLTMSHWSSPVAGFKSPEVLMWNRDSPVSLVSQQCLCSLPFRCSQLFRLLCLSACFAWLCGACLVVLSVCILCLTALTDCLFVLSACEFWLTACSACLSVTLFVCSSWLHYLAVCVLCLSEISACPGVICQSMCCSETTLTGDPSFTQVPPGDWTWVPHDEKQTGGPLDQWNCVGMQWDCRLLCIMQRWARATFFWDRNRNSATRRKHFRNRNSATFKEMLLRNRNSAIPQSQFFLESATLNP